MSLVNQETVLHVRHWNDSLFSFTTTRDRGLRFKNGHFLMIGLEVEGKPLMRAYSVASANYEDHLEFYSIKVPNGPLTSRLQHLQPGDSILVSRRPTGTLVVNNVLPGKRLYLLATGTGLAPFMSIIRDPETYERFEHVVIAHGVRYASELGYADYIRHELPQHEFIGEQVQKQLHYYPTVTREPYENQGRITDLLASDKLCRDVGLPALDPDQDRVMICGSPSMLGDLVTMLEGRGFQEGSSHAPAQYPIERAFVER
ncbi:MAG TPA: ferredoxin--NADP reductase [Polyangiales bacterium]